MLSELLIVFHQKVEDCEKALRRRALHRSKCEVVACESTSDFWVPIYELINDTIPVIVGNARDIKALSHKKTDKVDSKMIARLALHGMIQPSRIFRD